MREKARYDSCQTQGLSIIDDWIPDVTFKKNRRVTCRASSCLRPLYIIVVTIIPALKPNTGVIYALDHYKQAKFT